MANENVSFGGSTLVIPGAYYADNVSAALQPGLPTTPPLIFLGYSYGQKPQTAVTFYTASALLTAIRGGPASAYVPWMTNPSPTLFGAQQITFIDISENTQSTLALTSGNVASAVLSLTSTLYGYPSNQLQVSVTSGTTSGKNVTIYDGYANTSLVGSNLGAPILLTYNGTATGVTYTVSGTGGINVTTYFATSGANAGENVTLQFANYGTISQLATFLNGTGVYSAVVLGSQGAMPASNLDSTSASALTSGVQKSINATNTAINWWFNNLASAYATSVLNSGIVSVSGNALSNITLTAFSGASSVAPVSADYASGFNVALNQPGWSIFADSNIAAVQAFGTQHAITASSPGGGNRARRFYTGSSAGDSVATTVTNAQKLNSFRTVYTYPGIYANDPNTGVNTLYAGLFVAAAEAALSAGNPPATPLTNKPLNGTGVEVQLSTAQIDQLQQAGISPIWVSPNTGQPTIISDATTWQTDSNPENVFQQQVCCRDYLAYSLVSALNPYVGTIASTVTETRILTAVKNTLNALLFAHNTSGILNSWNSSSLQLQYSGQNQLASVSVSVVFVGQNRMITMLVNVLPLNITINALATS